MNITRSASRRFAFCALATISGLGLMSSAATAVNSSGSGSSSTSSGTTVVSDASSAPVDSALCLEPIGPLDASNLPPLDAVLADGGAVAGVPQAATFTVGSSSAIAPAGSGAGSFTTPRATLVSAPPVGTALPAMPVGDIMIDPGVGGCGFDADETNAEQHRLADYLTAHGVTFTINTADGVDWVQIDLEDQAAADALEDYYWEQNPLPQDVIDSINSDAEEIAAFLRERGIDVTVNTDRHGIKNATFDYEDPAANAAMEDFYWQKYPTPQEVIDSMNTEAERLAAFLEEHGVDATVSTDRHGIKNVDAAWDDADVQAAMTAYFEQNVSDFGVPIALEARADAAPAGTSAQAVTVVGNG